MREANGNYAALYESREAKLKACILLHGDNFRSDSQKLYSLLHEHIGGTGTGSYVITKYENSRNGYNCYRYLRTHFNNASFRQNKATKATTALTRAIYQGDRRNFNIETYYNIIRKNFNKLDSSGNEYCLSEAQKIAKFEEGMKETNGIKYLLLEHAVKPI